MPTYHMRRTVAASLLCSLLCALPVTASSASAHSRVAAGAKPPAPVSPLRARWTSLALNAPQPAGSAALAWDAADGVMFLFGGSAPNGASNDLWAYRPAATKSVATGWAHIAVTGMAPQAVNGASLVWDSADRVLLLFGGAALGREQSSLWSYKPGRGGTAPGRWVDLSSDASITRRAVHVAVWDGADGVMLVFGGETNGVRLADTWAYRPGKAGLAAGSWTRLGAMGPSPRQNAMAAWDSADHVLLLAGGYGYGYRGPLSDLWAFHPDHHGAGGAWTRLAETTPLGARAGAAAVWDASRGRLLVFGGDVATPTPTSTNTATATSTTTPLPTNTPTPSSTATTTPTNTPSATPTPTSTSSPVPPTATNTATASATPSPTATSTPTATASATATPTDTATASATATTGGVAPRALAGVRVAKGRPPSRPRSLLVTSSATYSDDLWSFTPGRHGSGRGRWQLVTTGGPSPRGAGAVYDDRDHLVILQGGMGESALSDVWVYPVSGRGAGAWTIRDGGNPPGRAGAAPAWDGRDGVLFVFGGYNGVWLNDLWAYKAVRAGLGYWRLVTAPGGPEGRSEASLVWDAADRVLLLFGGTTAGAGIADDVWAYTPADDGTATGRWSRLAASGAVPYARHLHSAVWDDRDRQMLVFGGQTATTVLNDLWAFRPKLAGRRGAWRQVAAHAPPTSRFSHNAVWDTTHGDMLLFGGADGSGRYLDDLWAYRPAGNAAGVWTSLGMAGVPDGRATAGAAWDPVDGALLLVGGTGAASYRNDTYAYGPASGWTALHPAGPPDRRSNPSVIYDTVSGGLLLYGGTGFTGAYNDLWRLGGVPLQSSHTPGVPKAGKAQHTPSTKH